MSGANATLMSEPTWHGKAFDGSWRSLSGGAADVHTWTETGLSQPIAAPVRRGFGSELIERTLAYELGAAAELHREPSGIRCTIALPVTERLALPRKPS